MLSREEILEEMGLWPIWRLRGQPGAQADAAAESAEQVLPTGDWPALCAEIAACRRCSLCEGRQQAVVGVGDLQADWLFVGEGPGAEEDKRGEPFVGPAGQLLDAMLAAIGLARGKDVYIANAVKCRPPQNRTPTAEEITACRPYLERQIDLLQPRLIVLLGKAAVQAVLGRDEAMARLRGEVFEYRGIPVIATYHPAYYLRSPLEKARGWEDLCRARRLMSEARR
jgi:DNA polymerase